MKFRLQPLIVAAAASCALLGGCVVAPAGYGYYGDGGAVYAQTAPPPLYAETVPVAPSPVHVWIGGYWGWGGGGYAWRPGRWAVPPQPGYVWQPRRWEPGPRGWQRQGGNWGPGPGGRGGRGR